jgi:hypothetical protein
MDFPRTPHVVKRGMSRGGVAYTVVEDRYGCYRIFYCYEGLRQRQDRDVPGQNQKASGDRVSNGGYRRRIRVLGGQ